MKIRYAQRAIADINAIADYFEKHNPQALRKVQIDLESKLNFICEFPESGRNQNFQGVRKCVTHRYKYIIHYTISDNENEIVVLAIRHNKQYRHSQDS